jgi:hypothetical protein
MLQENLNIVAIVLPALIGAIGGSLGGNLLTEWLKKNSEKEKLRKEIIDKYLIQFQYCIQSFGDRLYNIRERSGAQYMMRIKGSKDYYTITTMYSLGSILAYHRILLFEGIYSQINFIYPNFGSNLISKLDEFGTKLDNLRIFNPETKIKITFFKYDRMLLGDALTERDNNTSKLCSYLKFKSLYENDEKIRNSLEPARLFVENLPLSTELDKIKEGLDDLLVELEAKTGIKTRF